MGKTQKSAFRCPFEGTGVPSGIDPSGLYDHRIIPESLCHPCRMNATPPEDAFAGIHRDRMGEIFFAHTPPE
jgi:hypothetical protein